MLIDFIITTEKVSVISKIDFYFQHLGKLNFKKTFEITRDSPKGLVTLDADVRRTLHPLLDQRVGEVIPLLVSPLPLLRRLPPLVIV